MGERKIMPRRQVLAIQREITAVATSIRKLWSVSTWDHATKSKRAYEQMPEGQAAYWADLNRRALALEELAGQLAELSSVEWRKALEANQS